jgi:hypothetical protein
METAWRLRRRGVERGSMGGPPSLHELSTRLGDEALARLVKGEFMMRLAIYIAVVSFCMLAAPAAGQTTGPTPALAGLWSPRDASSVIEVAPCAANAGRLCAVVVRERIAPGEPSLAGQVVVRDLAPARNGRWRGRYVEDGADYAATVRLVSADEAEFHVCAAPLLCQTERYRRVPRAR